MRRLWHVLAVVTLAACSEKKETISINGVYTMRSQAFKGAGIDTTATYNKLLKIYTGSFMMFAAVGPANASGSFGVGTYTINGNTLFENTIYSASDTMQRDVAFADTAQLIKGPETLTLAGNVIIDKGTVQVTEIYEPVTAGNPSPIDGIWKQASAYTIKGRDTIHWNDVQYKAFYKGSFAYGEYIAGFAKSTYVSYGTFTLQAETLTETIREANTPSTVSKTVTLKVVMNDADTFIQTIATPDGQEVTVYKRMAK